MVSQTHSKQQYLPNSAIISTKFLSDEGVCTVTDFMPRPSPAARGDKPLLPWLVRRVEVIRGTLPFRLECFPAFDYARDTHETSIVDDERATDASAEEGVSDGQKRKKAVFKSSKGMTLELRYMTGNNPDVGGCGDLPDTHIKLVKDTETWPRHKGAGIVAEFTLQEGQTADFFFREDPATAEDTDQVPKLSKSVVKKAPIVERDGAEIKMDTMSRQAMDPLLTGHLAQTLLDAVRRQTSLKIHLTCL